MKNDKSVRISRIYNYILKCILIYQWTRIFMGIVMVAVPVFSLFFVCIRYKGILVSDILSSFLIFSSTLLLLMIIHDISKVVLQGVFFIMDIVRHTCSFVRKGQIVYDSFLNSNIWYNEACQCKNVLPYEILFVRPDIFHEKKNLMNSLIV